MIDSHKQRPEMLQYVPTSHCQLSFSLLQPSTLRQAFTEASCAVWSVQQAEQVTPKTNTREMFYMLWHSPNFKRKLLSIISLGTVHFYSLM